MENNPCSNDLPYFDSACNNKYVAPMSPFTGAIFHINGKVFDKDGNCMGEWEKTETGVAVKTEAMTHYLIFS